VLELRDIERRNNFDMRAVMILCSFSIDLGHFVLENLNPKLFILILVSLYLNYFKIRPHKNGSYIK
jgi:hypothetical protein